MLQMGDYEALGRRKPVLGGGACLEGQRKASQGCVWYVYGWYMYVWVGFAESGWPLRKPSSESCCTVTAINTKDTTLPAMFCQVCLDPNLRAKMQQQ